MSEAEIAYQISETFNRIWSMQQWWASISVGMIVLAYVASEKLNTFLVTIVIFLYSAFSFYIFQLLGRNWESISGYITDLQRLADSGQELAAGTLVYMQPQNPIVVALIIITMFGTYAVCSAYLVYSYFRGKRNINA
jgi:hypothetical protein